jgi:hypothetical protein
VYWLNLNAGYDGDIFLTVILNGAIHTVMYAYYFLSMHTKDIWWKKYLTLFQIIQFLTMNAQVGAVVHDMNNAARRTEGRTDGRTDGKALRGRKQRNVCLPSWRSFACFA